MKLNLRLIVMGSLILLAQPIVFVYGKLSQFLKSKESVPPAYILVQSHPVENLSETYRT